MDHARIIDAAFANPNYTRETLPPADINAILATHYTTDPPDTRMTKSQLWDMELRKAFRPDLYLGPLVKPTSLMVLDVTEHGESLDDERCRFQEFVRVTKQKCWLNPSEYTTVIEKVKIDHAEMKVYFVGAEEEKGSNGESIKAVGEDGIKKQPIFHVEHGAGGTEDEPLNLWRVVLLSESGPDERYLEVFRRIGQMKHLKYYVEYYIREVMGVKLDKKEA